MRDLLAETDWLLVLESGMGLDTGVVITLTLLLLLWLVMLLIVEEGLEIGLEVAFVLELIGMEAGCMEGLGVRRRRGLHALGLVERTGAGLGLGVSRC